MKNKIAQWALQHNIPRNALTDLLKILSPYHSLPLDSRTLMETKSCIGIKPMKDIYGGNGDYVYHGLQSQIIKILEIAPEVVTENDVIELMFNVDGIPLFRSSLKQFWPVLCAVTVGGNVSKPFVVSIYCGSSKPATPDLLLTDLVNELITITEAGITFCGRHLCVRIKGFICDAPARAFIKCTKGHTAYYGCERCEQKGARIDNKIVFPEMNAKKRSDDAFVSQEQEQHHKPGVLSPLLPLKIGLISQVPLEYMHLLCLGAMRRMLLHWLRGHRNVKVSMRVVDAISTDLQHLANHV